jgi:bloom syndrome protein
MIAYCENKLECRRQLVLAYFGEKFDKQKCERTCDNCENNLLAEERDISQHVVNLIGLVTDLQESDCTLIQLMDIYRGSKTAKIMDAGHNVLDGYAMGTPSLSLSLSNPLSCRV